MTVALILHASCVRGPAGACAGGDSSASSAAVSKLISVCPLCHKLGWPHNDWQQREALQHDYQVQTICWLNTSSRGPVRHLLSSRQRTSAFDP